MLEDGDAGDSGTGPGDGFPVVGIEGHALPHHAAVALATGHLAVILVGVRTADGYHDVETQVEVRDLY